MHVKSDLRQKFFKWTPLDFKKIQEKYRRF